MSLPVIMIDYLNDLNDDHWDIITKRVPQAQRVEAVGTVEQSLKYAIDKFGSRTWIASSHCDYSDFDFNEYVYPNGINTEFSRGCVAKCTFCEETHFWKYRQRMSTDALAEIEHLYYSKGTDVVWFIDSLVNGNLSELRAFCKAIIAKDIKLHWTGYCRCDGRMDLEFYWDLRGSGCEALNYGIESGSQKVLNDMAKGVTIPEMEQNLRDGKIVGISAFTNWIVGFPTEDYQDFSDTLTFIWRNRNQNILTIAAGFGFGMEERGEGG